MAKYCTRTPCTTSKTKQKQNQNNQREELMFLSNRDNQGGRRRKRNSSQPKQSAITECIKPELVGSNHSRWRRWWRKRNGITTDFGASCRLHSKLNSKGMGALLLCSLSRVKNGQLQPAPQDILTTKKTGRPVSFHNDSFANRTPRQMLCTWMFSRFCRL